MKTIQHSPLVIGQFRVGDLVRVLDGTHDPALPSHRTGLVVEVLETTSHSVGNNIYNVQFGASILKFHPMWLEAVNP
jgi:hypothetical protein